MTYASPHVENRLKTQLTALLEIGFEVHTLGFGEKLLPGVTKHIQIPYSSGVVSFARKAIIHLLKEPKHRFHALRVPKSAIYELWTLEYNLVITHDLELLPLICDPDYMPSAFRNAMRQVDLHELHDFVPPASGLLGFFWKVLGFRLKPYHYWLLSLLSSETLDLATVVNRSIGEWYVAKGYLVSYVEIMNCAPFRDSTLESRQEENLKFIYHGKFDEKRGLNHLVEASLELRPGDTIKLFFTHRFQ